MQSNISEKVLKAEKFAGDAGAAEDQEQFRVVISRDTNDVLEGMVRRANDGFTGGEITKSDVVNLIAMNYTKSFSESDIKTLRNLHFNEHKMLRALLRKSRNEGDLPDEIKRALREHFGMAEQGKKRAPKNHAELSTEKNVDSSSAA